MTDSTFGWRYVLRLGLGVVFIWAALAKIADPATFAEQIHNFRLVPVPLENLFAITMPWIELTAGVALVLNIVPRGATMLLGALLVVFMVAIASAIARNLDIDCGCFGTHDAAKTGWITLLRDVGFIAMAVFGYPRRRSHALAPSVSVEPA